MREPERLARRAARVIMVDEHDRVLLVHGRDPARPDLPSWWILPGGGLDVGESREDAARREVLEETGIRLRDLGPVVLHRAVTFEFDGRLIDQDEVLFLARTESGGGPLDTSGWNELEQRSLTELRWWSVAELAHLSERAAEPDAEQVIYPEELLELLRDNGIGQAATLGPAD